VEEACSLLKDYDGNIGVLAGGTGLLPAMKQRLFTFPYLLDLKRIPSLDYIEESADGKVKIGSLATLSSLENSPIIKKFFPGLLQAVSSVAAVQIKNMGTIGGNIALDTRCWYFNQSPVWRKSFDPCMKRGGTACHAVKGSKQCHAYFAADTVPVLIALGAEVTINNSEEEKRCSLESLYTHDGRAPISLASGDLITELRVPIPRNKNGSVYEKLRLRKAIDFPLVGSAVQVNIKNGSCQNIRIVLGAVGPGPIVVEEAEKLLKGKPITEDLIEEAGALAKKASKPVSNALTSPRYRREMAAVLTRSALRNALNVADRNQ
jgi:4-hydroxybenzoyl-CoA reductase subunit beta